LTWKQWGYILGMQGVLAMCINFGANFGIATAMYSSQKDVRMWVFSKNTIAGDLGVTPIIQTAISMLISSTLVHTDLHNGIIPPLPFVYPHVEHLPDPRILLDRIFRRKLAAPGEDVLDEKNTPQTRGGFSFYWWMLIRFIFEGTERNMLLSRPGFKNWWGRLLWTAAQGAGLGILLGFPLWCLAIVILGPIYGTGNLGNRWAPQAIKGVYGGLYGLYSNPIIAMIALGAQSEHHLLVVAVDEESSVEGEGVAAASKAPEVPAAPIHTIAEEDDYVPADGAVTPTPSARAPPSPFARPYRLASTGHSTPAHFRVGEPEPTETLQPPLRRTRSRSSSISRPPLTCNVGDCIPPSELGTPARPATRPRGLTTSSYVSASGSSFTYALSANGGRACRSRSNTVNSISGLPSTSAPSAGPSSGMPSPSASARLAVSPIPQPGFARNRANSDTPSRRRTDLSSSGSSDVFGPTSSAAPSSVGAGSTVATYQTAPTSVSAAPQLPPLSVPEVTIERPSFDIDSEREERAGLNERERSADPISRLGGSR
jgi:hypothetical protein